MKHIAACHCGAAVLSLAQLPTEVTHCNCSLCHKTGVLWAYYSAKDVLALPEVTLTETYAWNGKHVDFHRCRACGCVTHWEPRDPSRDKRGVNARLLPVEALAATRIRRLDGARTGKFIDLTVDALET